ncbi:DUF2312 domain-containing protein [uncultured Zoogloea sp.]|uniref:DUF2312 domain-containing protein n=1 Tax=uncultured Zoogloea sp. TaxID=160237 RepID=UPI0026083510|nr:DUF2312 domain-containing protein [uncultured Zoogloea sp.]
MAKKKRVNQLIAGELRGFIERYERLSAEMADIADQRKEVMAEAKGRGYDTKVLRLLIRERGRDPDELAEERAIAALYRDAIGMEGTPLDDWAAGSAPEVVAAEQAQRASAARVEEIVEAAARCWRKGKPAVEGTPAAKNRDDVREAPPEIRLTLKPRTYRAARPDDEPPPPEAA